MSRHRTIRNMNYAEERDDDDDDDYFGRSVEDDSPLSGSLSEYMYQRPRLNTQNQVVGGQTLSDFIPEEADVADLPNDAVFDGDEADMFQMDDVHESMRVSVRAPPGISTDPPPGFGPLETSTVSSQPTTVPQPPSVMVSSTNANKPFKPTTKSMPVSSSSSSGPGSSSSTATSAAAIPPSVVANLRVSETATNHRSASKSPSRAAPGGGGGASTLGNLPANSSSHRLNQLAAISSAQSTPRRTRKREKADKETINLVVVGHVDAGKSTLMGHLLCQIGSVEKRTLHKYQQEAARSGKASFAYAWVLDETDEERARGVTMDIARTGFETTRLRIVLLDAPGHRDFIPNMITGASQADAALLVANATRGEFETGFENGGQTREHAMLLRALGVSQLVVAVNKMDTVEWSERRYKEVESALRAFLSKQAGFTKVRFVPVSGLAGENLMSGLPAGHAGAAWYNGPSLLRLIDSFSAPPRAVDAPLRCVINDVLKLTPQLLTVTAKVEAGELETGEKCYVMPNGETAQIKAVAGDSNAGSSGEGYCGAGEQALVTLSGAFEADTIQPGHVIVCGGKDTLIPGRRFVVRIVVFDILIPIMKGTKCELFAHSLCEPCTVVRLVSIVSKATGEVVKERPRAVTRQQSARVELETERDIAIEPFTACRALGRLTLRANGQTIAAGIVEQKVG